MNELIAIQKIAGWENLKALVLDSVSSPVAALTFAHILQRDGRWCIVDLLGKHGRVRTAPLPQLGERGDRLRVDSRAGAHSGL